MTYQFSIRHKAFSFHYFRYRNAKNLFNSSVEWTKRCDHAGFAWSIEIFGLYFRFHLYDLRHWDEEAGKWMKHGRHSGRAQP